MRKRAKSRTLRHVSPEVDMTSGPGFLTLAEWNVLVRDLALSVRESEVLALLLRGASESTIATSLSLSDGTVHTYLRRLYLKLGAASRSHAVARVFAEYVAHARDQRSDQAEFPPMKCT